MTSKCYKHFFAILLLSIMLVFLITPLYADLGDTTLKKQMESPDVAVLQEQLHKLGYFNAESFTQYFGTATESALKKFQEEAGLPVNGIADSESIKALLEKVAQSDALSPQNTAPVDKKVASRAMVTSRVVATAKKYLGAPYVWGASSGKSFDCSGFVMYVMKNFDLNLDHSASAQFKKGTKVEKKDLKPGDLVFFTTYKKGPSHVGIYIGNNSFIHASSGVNKVTITDLDTHYYKQRYLGARRYPLSEMKTKG